jgi:RNA polymerase sigma-70 factor (ECF subfamily)
MTGDQLVPHIEGLHADAFGWALHCCMHDAVLAQDVLQEAYVKLVRGRARHDGSTPFKTWWFGVIRLTALEELRRARRQHSRLLAFFCDLLPGGSQTADDRPLPPRQIELDEEAARVRRLLALLPARQGEALHLVFYQEMSVADAAKAMGVSLGSARQHYERGKRRLRELYDREDDQ